MLSALLMTAVGVVLAWQVVTRSFVEYLADLEPEWALRLAPDNSKALLNLAIAKLNQAYDPDSLSVSAASTASDTSQGSDDQSDQDTPPLSPQDQADVDAMRAKGIPVPMIAPDLSPQARDDIRRLSEAALRRDPLDPRALRVLGQVAGSDDKKAAFMRAASAHSLHESLALYWLIQKSFLDGDFAKTLSAADALLRSQPQLADFVVPLFAHIAEAKDGLDLVKGLMRSNPPWSNRFFGPFTRSVSDLHLPLAVMTDLQANGTPPDSDDVKAYLNYLMKKKLYSFAYYTWLQFLPANQLRNLGLLFNGNFAFDPSGVPFDWTITYGSGVEIDILDNPDKPGHRALYWEFTEGRVDDNGVSQVTTLAPGNYSLHGFQKGDITARRGLRWRVACYDARSELAESQAFLGFVSDWQEFSMDFTVPRNCPAQRIWLSVDAVSDPDRLVSGSAWFADIGLSLKTQE